MDLALAVDFGSTFTKASLFDLGSERLIGTAYEASTVNTDVVVGLRAVLSRLKDRSDIAIDRIPARVCSSAAGGLRMVVVGLVPSLSLEAAQRAALGAGAKIVGTYGYKLSPANLETLASARPDLVLLVGGIDGGDEGTILHNAGALSKLQLASPVIVAGNQFVSHECVEILTSAGCNATLASNLFPEIDRIEVDEVHQIIRELFVRHITKAKGIERIADELNLVAPVIPTPAAVLRACALLASGPAGKPGLGDLILIDVGGATTDVHSACSGLPTRPHVVRRGLPELFLKRTVEGDLGMRVNASTIVERVGADRIAKDARTICGERLQPNDIEAYAMRVAADPNRVPQNEGEAALDAALARSAVATAVRRHAGSVKEVYTGNGTVLVQNGKDLSEVSTVIGVGGIIAFGRHADFILEGTIATADVPTSLGPRRPDFLVDQNYLLYAIGLLAEQTPSQAFNIAMKSLCKLRSKQMLVQL